MFRINRKSGKLRNPLLVLAIVGLVTLVGIVAGLRIWYQTSLKPVSSSQTSQYFTVEQGKSVHQIGADLEKDGLIRSSRAFETYVRGGEYADKLQAGTYFLSPSLSVQDIVKKMIGLF
jgi:UPF0755 protein